MRNFTIGIDIGTTGTKAILLEVGVGIVAISNADTLLHSDSVGYSEADSDDWIRNVHECIRALIDSSGCDTKSIRGISTTGMVPAVVLLDAEGKPLHRAVLQNDSRAFAEIAELSQQLQGTKVLNETGSPLSQQSVAPTVKWFQKNEHTTWSKTRKIVGSYDWVLIAMGAKYHVERNWALESGLFHIDGRPHKEIMRASGLTSEHLPEIVKAGDLVGYLDHANARAMGLPTGIPLFAGGADHVLSAYSAGVSEKGDGLIKLGGAGDILLATPNQLVDSRLYLDAHPIDGIWLPNGCMATSGSLIRWFQKIIGTTNLQEMDRLAENCGPAELLCLPYFLGEKSPLHDPDLRGAFFGMHLGTTQADLYRSVLEAIAFGFKHHVEVMEDLGIRLERAMVTNGGSKSNLWKQIHADVLGLNLYPVIDHPGAALGAAVIAAYGVKEIESLSMISDYIKLGPAVEPKGENVEVYKIAYEEWREFGSATTNSAHKLSERTRR